MSWIDRTFMTTEEVTLLSCPENSKALSNIAAAHYRAAVNKPTMFKLGEKVELLMHYDEEERPPSVIQGVIVAIRYTASQVRWDVAIPIANSDLWVVLYNYRDEMRSLENSNETEFIETAILERMVKRAFPTPLTVVDDTPS